MFTALSRKASIYSDILCFSRVAYCSTPKKYDPAQWHKAKPEDIPEGIWAEEKHSKFTGVEEVEGHWHYVERLFPKLRIPEPPVKESSTGWKAPAESLPDLPYFVRRTKNHMLPVFIERMYKDKILVTRLSKVQGDIYLLEQDLRSYLEEKLGKTVESNVNEIACRVNFRGDHKKLIEEWLYSKEF